MAGAKTLVITLPEGFDLKSSLGKILSLRNAGKQQHMLPSWHQDTCSTTFNNITCKQEPNEAVLEINEECGKPPRKRQRLDHLTVEEKLMRRKLKNRVAAQSARDRKKQLMDRLEDDNRALRDRVTDMSETLSSLSEQNDELVKRNSELEARLSECTCASEAKQRKGPILNARRDVVRVKTAVSSVADGSAARCHNGGSNAGFGRDAVSDLDSIEAFPLECDSDAAAGQVSCRSSEPKATFASGQREQSLELGSGDLMDHDYLGSPAEETSSSGGLTAAEERLIDELTLALQGIEDAVVASNSPASSGHHLALAESATASEDEAMAPSATASEDEASVLDFISSFVYDEDASPVKEPSMTLLPQLAAAPSSPITEDDPSADIECPSPDSSDYCGSSESGYDSVFSPGSPCSEYNIIDSFMDLFPNLC